MAPKKPPVVPPKPSRFTSSDKRVQKKPAPLRPSASQSSGRNQALRGPGSGNATPKKATRAPTVSSWTSRVESEHDEDDEHSATQVDLAMLGTALKESIRDNHLEFERRVNSGDNSPQLTEVSRHLLESPPISPDSLPSDGSPKSPVAMARLAKVQTQELDELRRKDAEFHRMMNDLSGIEQWWKANKIIWHEMREKIRQFDQDISSLQAQAEQHRQMVWDGKSRMSKFYGSTADFFDERWAPQIEELKQLREANLGWFVNNRKLMKAVWASVKEMGDALYMENKDNRKLSSKYPATRNITELEWFQNLDKGIRWWEKAAGGDMIILRDKIQAAIDGDLARAEQRGQQGKELKRKLRGVEGAIEYDDTFTDGKVSQLQDLKPRDYEAQIAKILSERRLVKVDAMREEIDLRAMIKDLEIRDQEATLMRKHLTDIRERNRQTYRRIKYLHDEMPKIDPMNNEGQTYFYGKLYHIVRHHIHRTVLALEFAGMLDQVSYAQDKRSKIIERMELYEGSEFNNTETYLRSFQEQLVPKNWVIHHRALRDVAAVSSSDGRDFHLMVRTCQAIIDAAEPLLNIKTKANPALYLVPDVNNVVLNKPPPETPFNMARPLGSTITLTVAKTILEHVPPDPEVHADKNWPWYELLRHFFVSSDIFPLFRANTIDRRSWNRDEFISYVNSLLKTPIERRVIEAFLAYCSHTGDLFRLTEFRRRVEVISTGWELCEENKSMGPYRKVSLASLPRPQGIDRLETVLRKHWRELECDNPDREVDEADLRRVLNGIMPNHQRISKERLRKCVSYWSTVGQFFSLMNPIEEGGVFAPTKLIRLDAGWNLPSNLPLLPITTRPANYDLIVKTLREKGLYPLIMKVGVDGLNERNVYRYVFLDNKKGGMNWEVSRYQFHCVARYASQRGIMFDMGRNGKLRIIQSLEGAQRAAAAGTASGSRGGGSGQSGRQGSPGGSRRDGGGAAGGQHDGKGDYEVSYQGTTFTQFINH